MVDFILKNKKQKNLVVYQEKDFSSKRKQMFWSVHGAMHLGLSDLEKQIKR